MSIKSQLDSILQRLSKNADELDASTKNISNATSRITYEVTKGQSLHAKYNLPKEKYEQVIKFTQSVADVCSNFVPPKDGEQGNDVSDPATDAIRFERFVSQAEKNLEKSEKEIVKLSSLRHVIDQVSEQ